MMDQPTEESPQSSGEPEVIVKKCLWPADSPSNLTRDDLLISSFTTKSQVPYFISKIPDEKASEDSSPGRTCKYCLKFCFNEADALQHESTHRANKKFFCPICNAGFTRRSYFEKHQQIHAGVRFQCPKCTTSFSLESNLKRHVRQHGEQKSFTCHICTTSFKLKTTLMDHVRTHTGERPYACPLCPERYSRPSSLRRHSRVHSETSESPECYHCHKKFAWKSELRRHTKTHLLRGDTDGFLEIPLPQGLASIEGVLEIDPC